MCEKYQSTVLPCELIDQVMSYISDKLTFDERSQTHCVTNLPRCPLVNEQESVMKSQDRDGNVEVETHLVNGTVIGHEITINKQGLCGLKSVKKISLHFTAFIEKLDKVNWVIPSRCLLYGRHISVCVYPIIEKWMQLHVKLSQDMNGKRSDQVFTVKSA